MIVEWYSSLRSERLGGRNDSSKGQIASIGTVDAENVIKSVAVGLKHSPI
jgi:hypothetical protein